MKKYGIFIITFVLLLCSCDADKNLKVSINNDVFIYTDLKMDDFLKKGYESVSDSYDGHPLQLGNARFDTLKYDLSKNNLIIQITLSGLNDLVSQADQDKNRGIFRIRIEKTVDQLNSFKIEDIECIGLTDQELLETFQGERFNQYVEFTVKKYRFRFKYINNQLASISWLADTAKAYI